MRKKGPKDNGESREGIESAKVGLLAGRLIRVVGPRANTGGVILNMRDGIARKENLAKGLEVKPLVRRAFKAAVIEIESVNVNVGAHFSPQKKQKPPEGGFAPCPEGAGGIALILPAGKPKVK
jgi:hypothetical protein